MLSLVLPKGSLERATLQLFEDADLAVQRSSDVEYRAGIDDPRVSTVRILRPQEIPRYVAEGRFDLGVTGRDWVEETAADVVSLGELHYSKNTGDDVRIVLAVAADNPVASVEDLPAGVRVHTEYPELTRRYFAAHGITADVSLSYGATEAKVPDIADAVVELTETGRALRAAGLRILDTVLTSATELIAHPGAYRDPERRRAMEQLHTLLSGVLEARGRVLLKLNVDEAGLTPVLELLPALKAPTVSKLSGGDAYAVESVVAKTEINTLIPALKERARPASSRSPSPRSCTDGRPARPGRGFRHGPQGWAASRPTTATGSGSTAPDSATPAETSRSGPRCGSGSCPATWASGRPTRCGPQPDRAGVAATMPLRLRAGLTVPVRFAAGVHQRHMAHGLREVPEQPPGVGLVLLGQQSDVVAQPDEPLEQRPRVVEAAHERQVVGQPERARQEDPLTRRQPVDAAVRLVAAHEAVRHQLPLDGRHRAPHPQVVRRQEPDERDHQQAGVERRRPVGLHEAAPLGVVAVGEHVGVHLVPQGPQPVDVHREQGRVHLRRLHRPVERHPRHDLRVREVTPRAPHLPDPIVGLAPPVLEELHDRLPDAPHPGPGRYPEPAGHVQRVGDLAVHVELELLTTPRCRSAPDGTPRSRAASRARVR